MENKTNKKVVLLLSKTFPMKHISKGMPTSFSDKINGGTKIHTIRSNYDMWKHNIDKVNEAGFILSLRQWKNRPYRSRQEEFKRLSGASYERIAMMYDHENGTLKAVINGKQYLDVRKIAENDGLSWNDFICWFFGNGRSYFEGIIIHFTDFKYNIIT